MIYHMKSNRQTIQIVSIGSVSINLQQIIIGVIGEVIALIPSLFLVQLFRRLQPRHQPLSLLHQTLDKIKVQMKMNVQVEKKKSRCSIRFAWWWIFIGYGLCLILSGVSILLIIARGIEFGDVKSQQWLISVLSGLLSSILFTQPIKVLSLAIFFTCFCRSSNEDDEANEYFDDNDVHLESDQEYLHSTKVCSFFCHSKERIRLKL